MQWVGRNLLYNNIVLKKINRISREVEIKEVLKNGKYLHTDFWMRKILIKEWAPIKGARTLNPVGAGFMPAQLGNNKKFLIIVSKKVAKLAVDRNRMKRLAYEVIRKNLEKLPEGIRMVLVVKKAYEKIGDEIISGL